MTIRLGRVTVTVTVASTSIHRSPRCFYMNAPDTFFTSRGREAPPSERERPGVDGGGILPTPAVAGGGALSDMLSGCVTDDDVVVVVAASAEADNIAEARPSDSADMLSPF